MTLSRWTGSTWNPLGLFRRWTGSAWQNLSTFARWNGSSWINFSGLTAIVAPTSAIGSNPSGVATTNSVAVTVTNGSGAYTYAWTVNTSSGSTITAGSPTAATTVFRANINGGGSNGTAFCTVTDTVSLLTANTGNVVISLFQA